MAFLDWTDAKHWSDDAKPCVICRKPTNLRSDRGRPCHKTCAEQWIDAHRKPSK